MTKPLVYVAGPMSSNPLAAVRTSLPCFRILRNAGAIPFMPQWSVIAEIVEPWPYEQYMDYDFDIIRRCDGLVRLPGASPGADREWALAEERGMPRFRWRDTADRLAVEQWIRDWRERRGRAFTSPW